MVDLWGGHADGARTRPWERDTLVNVWSTTKGVMALCVARLNDQGLLANDRPVADYWPEFAANGKARRDRGPTVFAPGAACAARRGN